MTSRRAYVSPRPTPVAESSYASSPVHPGQPTSNKTTNEAVLTDMVLPAGLASVPTPSRTVSSCLKVPDIEKPFRIFDLPPEFRSIICRLAIETEFESQTYHGPYHDPNAGGFRRVGKQERSMFSPYIPPIFRPAIMKTCKELQMECQRYYFAVPRDLGYRSSSAIKDNPFITWAAGASSGCLKYMTRARFSQDILIRRWADSIVVTILASRFPEGQIEVTSRYGAETRDDPEVLLNLLDSRLFFEGNRVWIDKDSWSLDDHFAECWHMEGSYHTDNVITAVEDLVKVLENFNGIRD